MDEDEELLAALGVSAVPKKKTARSAEEARVIAGFEDILRFVEAHGRAPAHGEDNDIFERLYAVRLDRLRQLTAFHPLLAPLDSAGLLQAPPTVSATVEEADDDALLEALGVGDEDDLSNLKHVRPRAEIRAAEEIANRTPCKDFAKYKPLFEELQREIEEGIRETRPFGVNAEIQQGEFFVLGGVKAYVASFGEVLSEYDRLNRRVHLIFDNGTESEMLLRSFQRALYKDGAGRRITDALAGPLFGVKPEDDDLESGTIYVLRSHSDHPDIAKNRNVIHKIGVTGGDVEGRIASAATDPTYLLAEVEVVATYKLFNINRSRLENTLHRVLAPARLDLEIADRFGNPVRPREWFLVPLPVINEVVDRIRDQTITRYRYDPGSAKLTPAS
ncbi:MAG: GIY-YIG nuclease family protein [Hyphomonadaceae bacterium]|nr:GIY-YIG nuclease family protein [Hyphomonadaceae bacterium]